MQGNEQSIALGQSRGLQMQSCVMKFGSPGSLLVEMSCHRSMRLDPMPYKICK